MKRSIGLVALALLILPAAAHAGFGIGAHYELHPFLAGENFNADIDLKNGDDGEDDLDMANVITHSVYLGLGRTYVYGFADFIIGYEGVRGEFDEHHFDDAFEWDFFATGIHGGGLVPVIDYLRIQIAVEATASLGQFIVEDQDVISDFAWGGAIGLDLELRFYPGAPPKDEEPSGFFVGAGMGFKYTHREAWDSEGNIDTAVYKLTGWTIGFTIIHIGFGS